MPEFFGAAERLNDAIARKGATISIRRITTTPGPVPLLNPPTIVGPLVLAAPVAAGDQSVTLSATSAYGQLLPGDMLLFAGGMQATVASPVVARAALAGFGPVPLTKPLPYPQPALWPVSMLYAADLVLSAMIDSFPLRLIDGERLQTRDLSITVSALSLPEVKPTWSILLNGRELSIVNALPIYERSSVVKWSIQAR